MNNLRTTTVKPLMVNFISPKDVEKAELTRIVYDAQEGITYFFGGGEKKATRCYDYDTRKVTKEEQPGGTYTHDDTERYTDD